MAESVLWLGCPQFSLWFLPLKLLVEHVLKRIAHLFCAVNFDRLPRGLYSAFDPFYRKMVSAHKSFFGQKLAGLRKRLSSLCGEFSLWKVSLSALRIRKNSFQNTTEKRFFRTKKFPCTSFVPLSTHSKNEFKWRLETSPSWNSTETLKHFCFPFAL